LLLLRFLGLRLFCFVAIVARFGSHWSGTAIIVKVVVVIVVIVIIIVVVIAFGNQMPNIAVSRHDKSRLSSSTVFDSIGRFPTDLVCFFVPFPLLPKLKPCTVLKKTLLVELST
jgi:amino acid transporter